MKAANRFVDEGIDRLYDKRRSNGRRKVDDRFRRRVARLLLRTPESFGWQRPTWTRSTSRMLDRAKIDYLHEHHPEWPLAKGAFGDKDMLGGLWAESLLHVPDVAIDSPRALVSSLGLAHYMSIDVGAATFIDRPTGTWDRMFGRVSATMGSHGALANDVLLCVRLVIDYARQRLYVQRADGAPSERDSDSAIGISSRFAEDGFPTVTQPIATCRTRV